MISNQIGQSSVTLPHSSPPFSRLASVQVSRRCIHYFTKEHETRHPGSFFVGPSRRAGHGRKDAPYLYKRDLYYLLTCVMYSMFFALWLHMLDHDHSGSVSICIQLFRERLSEKVHATIPKGIGVVCFEFTSSSMIFEKMARERPWTYLC